MSTRIFRGLALCLALLLLGAALAGCTATTPGTTTTAPTTTGAKPNPQVTYYADIVIRDYGTITIQLDATAAPITVANFVKLAESGYYNGLTFHRIIANFMMQGGDIDGDGYSNGDKETIYGEFPANGWNNSLKHTRGAISMARSNYANSASTQFFIVHQDAPTLDGYYAVFGYVTQGIEVVDAVCAAARPVDDNGSIPPEEQPVMTSVTIRTEPTA